MLLFALALWGGAAAALPAVADADLSTSWPSIASAAAPGVAAPATTSQAVSSELARMTGLSISQVSDTNACPPAGPGMAQCEAQVVVLRASGAPVRPRITPAPTFTRVVPGSVRGPAAAGMTAAAAAPPNPGTPAYLQQAYDLDYLSQTAGSNDTVAIVDAFNDPGAEADLATFRASYGLSACTTANGCFRKVNQSGQTSPLPAANSGWEEEESLDLDAVSSLCPNCHIILVEANDNSTSNLDTAVSEAQSLGAEQVSNSWAGTSSGPYGQSSWPGTAVIAATGDHGYPGAGWDDYPAAFPAVTAAGGTSLAVTSASQSLRGYSESAWSLSNGWGGGSGCDLSEPKPSYQTDTGCTGRSWSDLSADADPNTGLGIYDSGNGGWLLMGGTSLATPLVAAFEAITGVSGATPQWAYGDSALLNDPTTGSTGSCAANMGYICNAGTGYDGPTGIGSISGDVTTGGPGIGAETAPTTLSTGATVSGGVYPNGADTTVTWQYGTSTSYGQSTGSADAGAGATPAAVSAQLTGLAPSTTYHFRLVASNRFGTMYGYDETFTTQVPTTPPTSTAPPVITGTAAQGVVVSASTGTWNPASGVSFAYQWQRSADGGQTWTTIAGATGSTYKLAAADVGDEVTVALTGGNAGGSTTVAATAIGPVASSAPRSLSTPAITGTPAQGDALTVSGSWNPAGSSYAYQWQRSPDGTAWTSISGATGSSYTPGSADEADTLRAIITATNPYGSASATSGAVGPVAANPPVNTVAPALAGTTQRTYVLSATPGTWNGPSLTLSYQWQRSPDGTSWSPIAGATASSLKLIAADDGQFDRVVVSASNVDGVVTATSTSSALVSPYPPGNLTAPAISGTPERTYALSATQGTWTGPDNTYAYQWQRDFGEGYVDIPGATASTYTLTAADEGAVVRVVVTATNPDGVVVQDSQPTTTVLAALPISLSPPSVTGTAARSSVLTGLQGNWGGAGNTYALQWQRSADGNAWANISSATAPTYTVGVPDEGSMLRLLVTATNADGTVAVASAATGMVASAPPVSTAAPVVTGTAQRSSQLTATAGSWGGIGNAYSYQWQSSSDGSTWTNIAGASASTLTLASSDEGDSVRVAVTATNPDGTVTTESAPTAAVQGAPPVNAAVPTVSGSAQRGTKLAGTNGSWNGVGNTYALQWQRSADGGQTWTNISGATGGGYTLAPADEGDEVRLLVSASNPDGTVAAASAPTLAVVAEPPVSTAPPTITGAAARGSLITSAPGTWSGVGNSLAYQWQRSTDSGQTWTSIAGATDTAYTVVSADEGAMLRLLITATNLDGSVAAASAPTTTVPSAAPVNTSAPTISGSAQRGVTLVSTPGSWGGVGNAYANQWQRSSDGVSWTNVPNATGSSYALSIGDEGDEIRLLVTVSNIDGTATAASAPTAPVQAAAPLNTVLPVLTGTPQRTGKLTSSTGTWSGAGNSYAYQWQENTGHGFTNVTGATGSSLTLGIADEGTSVRLLVTATNPDGTVTVASAAVGPVAAAPPVNVVAPTISGTAQRSFQLAGTQGAWTGIGNTYTFQWQRSVDSGTTWTNINGATSLNYTLGTADEGDIVRLAVTATNPDATVVLDTPPSATVLSAPPANTVPPTITGPAQRGGVLSATPGTWNGLGNTITEQWQRSSDGSTWTSIAGATAATYTAAAADEGDELRVLVSAANPDGTASTASAPSAPVAAEPPVNTVAPAVSGTAQRGTTLSAATGTWSGVGNTYTDQWQSSSDGGLTWTNLTGATATTFTLGPGDEGNQLRVLVTATNPDATISVPSAPTGAIASAPPVNTSLPAVSGTPIRSGVLTSSQGIWTGVGNAYTLQWQRSTNGTTWSAISGATGPTYVLTQADERDNVRLLVSASNADGTLAVPSPATAAVQAAPPVNTALPVVSGSPRIGAVLTVDTGTWTPSGATYTYSWQRGDPTSGYQAVAGATAPSYTVTSADTGESLRVLVTATNVDGASSATTAASSTVVPPPRNTTAPAAPSGTLEDSYTLTPDPGVWNAPVTLAYAWERCPGGATAVTGACTQVSTAASYVLSSTDVGHAMAVEVSASSTGGTTTVASALTATVAGRPLVNLTPPTISGNPQIPNTLTAQPGTWSVTPTGVAYTWERCGPGGTTGCTAVSNGPGTYTLGTSDLGNTIVLVAQATSPGRTASAQSAPLTVEAAPLPEPATQPVISGTPARDLALSVSAGTWTNSPTKITYQWELCNPSGSACQAIAGATWATYTPQKSDEGATLAVAVTAANSVGQTTTSTRPSAVVAASPPVVVRAPAITGTVQQGAVLQATGDSWHSTPDTTYAIQWQRCAADGTGCQPIAGATLAQYTPLSADAGHALEVVITATNPDASVPAASPATAAVMVAAPRWRALPTISQDAGHVGDTVTMAAGSWTGGPTVATDTVAMMRCTDTCVSVATGAGSYTITSADVGAVLRVRETASNAGGSTVVWSSWYIGPVTSTSSGSAVLGGGAAVLRNSSGAPLATAALSGPALARDALSLAHARRAVPRHLLVSRAQGVRGRLRVWVCPVVSPRGSAPGRCTRALTFSRSARVTIPAAMTGRLRVVVVRRGA